MKAQTHHTNLFGTVTNPSTATGFTLEDDHGGRVEANVVDGKLVIEYRGVELSDDDLTIAYLIGRCENGKFVRLIEATKVERATVRSTDCDDVQHVECRFKNGEKFAAVETSGPYSNELAAAIAHMLNAGG